MEDPEVRSKVLWEGMQLVEPWENEEVSDDIFATNPTFLPRDRLSPAQQSVRALHQSQFVKFPDRPQPSCVVCNKVAVVMSFTSQAPLFEHCSMGESFSLVSAVPAC